MFEAKGLERLIRLHEKSYGLFTWLNGSLREGRRSLASVAGALAFSEAAGEWLQRNLQNLPEEHRPAPDELDEFSHLLVSYLSTSFEVVERSAVRACPGCWCCVYWIESKHLRARNPDRKARATAGELKVLYLRRLSEEAGLPFLDPELEKFVDRNRDLARELSLATYASELARRTRFASQGEGVLALWREIAWDAEGHPNRKFRLKPAEILKAEAALKARLEASAAWPQRGSRQFRQIPASGALSVAQARQVQGRGAAGGERGGATPCPARTPFL